MRRVAAVCFALSGVALFAASASANVLRVGTYRGIRGQYRSVQAAVKAAKPGDWILVGPGDYKTKSSSEPAGRKNTPAGVLLTKPRVYLRGMNRNTVIIDGTKSGPPCSRAAHDQNLGPRSKGGHHLGLNGIMVWKAANVWVQNLTVCNFLSGKGDAGNEIWWNGGDGSGKIGGHRYYGSYLSATNTFYRQQRDRRRSTGSSPATGPAAPGLRRTPRNFSDSGYYIGACQQRCDQTINHAHAEFNALGYSGTNSGGPLVVKNSEFDQNQDGFDTDSRERRSSVTAERRVPEQRHQARSPIRTRAGCSWTTTSTTTTTANVPEVGQAGSTPLGVGPVTQRRPQRHGHATTGSSATTRGGC